MHPCQLVIKSSWQKLNIKWDLQLTLFASGSYGNWHAFSTLHISLFSDNINCWPWSGSYLAIRSFQLPPNWVCCVTETYDAKMFKCLWGNDNDGWLDQDWVNFLMWWVPLPLITIIPLTMCNLAMLAHCPIAHMACLPSSTPCSFHSACTIQIFLKTSTGSVVLRNQSPLLASSLFCSLVFWRPLEAGSFCSLW